MPMTRHAGAAADAMDASISDEDVALNVVYGAAIDRNRARAAFADLSWFGQAASDAPGDGWRRITTDLELPVLDGSGPAVRKSAIVDIGQVHETRVGLSVPISWTSASLTPLFPVFAGRLEIRNTSLVMTGRYAPPFGRMGLLIDRALLHFVATRSATALLATVARHCRQQSFGSEDR
jgi:hypothetical protein